MIKPIEVSPLNITNKYYFECTECGKKDVVTFTNRTINTDNDGNTDDLEEEPCPFCEAILKN